MITEDLKTKLSEAYNTMQSITTLCGTEKREMTSQESEKFDKASADYDRLKTEIRRFEAAEAAKAEQREAVNSLPAQRTEHAVSRDSRDSWREGLVKYLRTGQIEQRAGAGIALSQISGYNADEGFQAKFTEQLKYFGGVYNVPGVNVVKTDTWANYPIFRFDDTANSGSVLSGDGQAANIATAGSGYTAGLSQITLGAYTISSNVQVVSLQFLDSIEDLNLAQVCGTEVGRKLSTLLVTGTGSSQPTGILTSATSSFSTAHYNTIAYADLLGFYHSIDKAYRDQPSFAFVMNDSTLKAIRELTDTNGRPLYYSQLAGISGSNVLKETLFGHPVVISNDMPALGTASNNIIAAGAWSYLTIREVKTPIVIRMNDRFAEYLAVGFVTANGFDSNLTATNAVKLCTLNSTTA